ncbi:MAG TPA: hypothetical protein VE825_09255 [Terriglobales bacterium]|jgi:hypothetical protein|nr:hypothetical protein [Terriglobales bacterium]
MSLRLVLSYALWIGPALLQAALAVIMVRRKLHQQFPAFFLYTTYEVASFSLLFVVYHLFWGNYFYVFWACSAIGIALGFAVILEVFSHAFQPYSALHDLGRVLFRWVALFLLLVAIVLALAAPGNDANRIVAGVLALDRSIRVMQCGLVLFLVLFLPHLGLSWKHNLVGIGLGFGLYASVQLMMVTLRVQGGTAFLSDATLSLFNSVAYAGTVVLWTVYLLLPEPARRPVLAESKSERWDHALAGIQHPGGEESFLPRLEARVERVMARYNTAVTAPPQSRYWN